MRSIVLLVILCQAAWCFADPGAARTDSETTASDPTGPYTNIDALFTLYQPYLDNISAYQPIYFLVGTDPGESAFQFSFKYRLFDLESPLAETYHFMNGLHFAYTQTSFWNLAGDSLPFEDTGYKPEIFWASSRFDAGLQPHHGLYFQTGLLHESNGRGGDDSRSTNFLYAQPIYIHYDAQTTFGVLIAPKVWGYVDNEAQTNPDLPAYRGYFDLHLKCGLAESLVVGSNFRWAQEGASVQVDATFPMHRLIAGISGMYLQIQYVNALAESLLHYDERTEAIRIGLAIIR